MNKKVLHIVACKDCYWLGSNSYQNSWRCRNPHTINKAIYGDMIIPDWCKLLDATGESDET